MGLSLQLWLILVFVDLELVAARRCNFVQSTRCPLRRDCPGSTHHKCKNCVDHMPNPSDSGLPWCLRCPVCKATQTHLSPCSQRGARRCKREKLDLTLTVEAEVSEREVPQVVTNTSAPPTTIPDIHIKGKGGFANDFSSAGSDTVPTWAIAVAVVCPVLAMVTVAIVWQLRKSIIAREQQPNNGSDEEMVPLTTAEQVDDETNHLSGSQTLSGTSIHDQVGAPVFSKALQCGHALIGMPVFLSCEVEGSPEPVIQWRKDGMELADRNAFQVAGTTLTVVKVTPELGGQYVCIATNKHGQAITRATVAVRGNFEEVDSDEDMPSVKATINSNLPIVNPQDTALASAGASVYYNDFIQQNFEMRYPGGDVKLGPSAGEDEDSREYRERMALHTSHYEDSYLKEYQEERRLANAMRLEEYGFTATTINWVSGKEEDETVPSTSPEEKDS